jgi:hypothetical protein
MLIFTHMNSGSILGRRHWAPELDYREQATGLVREAIWLILNLKEELNTGSKGNQARSGNPKEELRIPG